MSTTTITGTINGVNNTALANKWITFRLVQLGTDSAATTTVAQSVDSVQTDANGDFSIDIWNNGDSGKESALEITIEGSKAEYVVIPEGLATIQLWDLIENYQIPSTNPQFPSISESFLKKSNNLSDLEDIAISRQNLDVPSKSEVILSSDIGITVAPIASPTFTGTINTSATGIDFDPGTVGGELSWNDQEKTLDLVTGSDNVTVQIGQEVTLFARNSSGAAMFDGQVVMVDGSQGNKPTISLAQADTVENARKTIGIVTQPIPNNSNGFVTLIGKVRDLVLDSGTFTEGDVVYLSSTVAGGITNVKPNIIVELGHVLETSTGGNTSGVLEVQVNNESAVYELEQSLTTLINQNTTDIDTNSTAIALNTLKQTNADHDGDVTGSQTLSIADGAVDINNLSAGGTPSALTFLRGDNTWAVSGTGTGSGNIATDPIWGQLGDLAVGTGISEAIRLGAGVNGQVLTASSGQPSGLEWKNASEGVGDVANDLLWQNNGDLVVGTGLNTAQRLPLGQTGQSLSSDGTNLVWADNLNVVATDEIWQNSGDLVIGSGLASAVRLGSGSDNQVLTVNGSVAGGIEWQTPSGGSGGSVPFEDSGKTQDLSNSELWAVQGNNGTVDFPSYDYPYYRLSPEVQFPVGQGSYQNIKTNFATDPIGQLIDWSLPISISVDVTCANELNSDVITSAALGHLNSSAGYIQPTGRCIGFKIENQRVYIFSGNSNSQGVATDIGSNGTELNPPFRNYTVKSNGLGTVSLYIDGILLGSVNNGPTAASPFVGRTYLYLACAGLKQGESIYTVTSRFKNIKAFVDYP